MPNFDQITTVCKNIDSFKKRSAKILRDPQGPKRVFFSSSYNWNFFNLFFKIGITGPKSVKNKDKQGMLGICVRL